ncbi:MAG TPA: TAXI family TRAP transporter solute-binding subunit [Stellaceae bacterium]|nr:TAXI family TRAP transporter solute-binding subunit [Stellaceae bacterium]
MPYSVPEPRLKRSVTLQFQGDWGAANLHRILGWLSQELVDRTGPYSRIGIWSGRGGLDSVQAVGRGQVDAAFAVPSAFVPMTVEGKGIAKGEAFPQLRALGTMPQTDRLVVAVRAEHGIRSFEDFRRKAPKLRIACSQDDGVNTIGFAAQRLMEAAGLPRTRIAEWGGSYVERERPNDCVALVREGKADAIIHEAIMTQWWQDLANGTDMTFLPVEEETLATMMREYHWPRATLPAGYLKGMNDTFTTLDFSDFLMIARDDMPDDVAYLVAWCMCERRQVLERFYAHIKPERSPVTYPLVPAKIATTSIPLHKGAERYYREAKVIP